MALLEGQAARARCGALVAVAEAHAFDPGLEIKFSKNEEDEKNGTGSNSWSSVESEKSRHIMTREIPTLKEQLAAHDEQVLRQRADMNNSVWN